MGSYEEAFSSMIYVQTDDISEQQLAEIALAIQNRWEVPTFVKMHEVVIMDEDVEDRARKQLIEHFETGLSTIFENLDMTHAFSLAKSSRTKYFVRRIPGSQLPQWMTDIETPTRVPDGVYECPHCGRWFNTEIERSLHTKIHYLI